MRAVTEPYSPRVVEPAASDAASADDAVPMAGGAPELTGESTVGALEAAAAAAWVHPAWAQLAHLENLLGQWMSGNPACEQTLADLQRHETPLAALVAPLRATTVVPTTTRSGSDYVSQLAAKLVRRSA